MENSVAVLGTLANASDLCDEGHLTGLTVLLLIKDEIIGPKVFFIRPELLNYTHFLPYALAVLH